jgi:hypothetical protein
VVRTTGHMKYLDPGGVLRVIAGHPSVSVIATHEFERKVQEVGDAEC